MNRRKLGVRRVCSYKRQRRANNDCESGTDNNGWQGTPAQPGDRYGLGQSTGCIGLGPIFAPEIN